MFLEQLLLSPYDALVLNAKSKFLCRLRFHALFSMSGGESTTMSLYLKRNKMEEPLRAWIMNEHHVTWGTCAGMILLSKVMENQKQGGQTSVSLIKKLSIA